MARALPTKPFLPKAILALPEGLGADTIPPCTPGPLCILIVTFCAIIFAVPFLLICWLLLHILGRAIRGSWIPFYIWRAWVISSITFFPRTVLFIIDIF